MQNMCAHKCMDFVIPNMSVHKCVDFIVPNTILIYGNPYGKQNAFKIHNSDHV